VVSKIGEKLHGMKITVPPEPQIAGAVGAALFALDRARKHHRDARERDKEREGDHASQ
jgi:activator of 2-hydroxyglutaryl-CoA dehydratase